MDNILGINLKIDLFFSAMYVYLLFVLESIAIRGKDIEEMKQILGNCYLSFFPQR